MDCLCIKVAVDVSKPLKRGIFLLNDHGAKTWYQVTYEEDFVEPTEGLPYGAWMRANGDGAGARNSRVPLQEVAKNSIMDRGLLASRRRGEAVFNPYTDDGPQKENSTLKLNMARAASDQHDPTMLSEDNQSDNGRTRVMISSLKRKKAATLSPPKDAQKEERNLIYT